MKGFICSLVFVVCALAWGDGMNSGWSFTLTCPDYDQTGSSGSLTVSNPSGFSCTGGCGTCQRLSNNRFQSVNFSGESLPGGASLTSSTIYSVNVGKFLFVPPVLNTDTNPIFSVASRCNNYTASVNYLFIQIDPSDFSTIENTYIWGQSTLSPTSATLLNDYDITGTQTWSGSTSLPIGSCSGGVWSVSGASDFNAKMYSGDDWSGLYKTGPGRATLFLPGNAITQSYLGSTTYTGILFNSGSPGSVQNVQVTSNAAGSTFSIIPYTNVSTNTLSGVNHWNISISAVNSPFNGAMMGTVTHNGAGSGRVVCLANVGGGLDGQIVACSGEDPLSNTTPYSVVFDYKPPAGTLDTLFNGTGSTLTSISTYSSPNADAGGLVIDSSGKITIGGLAQDASGYYNFAVARYQSDGTLDTTFNSTGKVLTQLSTNASPNTQGRAIALDSLGRIIVAGYATDASGIPNFAVARYDTDGTLDTTFNGTGKVLTQVSNCTSPSSDGHAVAVDASGKIVVAGKANDPLRNNDFAVARYNSDGTLDTTFNSTGMVLTQVSTSTTIPDSEGQAIAIDGSGKIVVAGYAEDISNDAIFAIARYNTDGTLDTTFNSTGMVLTQVSTHTTPESFGYSVAIDSSGRIVVAGQASDSTNNENFGIARYNTDGTLDTTFNSTGKALVQISTYTTPYSSGSHVAVDGLGKIVVTGHATDNNGRYAMAVVRFNTDGTLDATFNSTGKFLLQLSTAATANQSSGAEGVAIDSLGKINISGSATVPTAAYEFAVLRLVP